MGDFLSYKKKKAYLLSFLKKGEFCITGVCYEELKNNCDS